MDSARLLIWLRAVGEPTRLRLLALCARGDFSVSDLAQGLRQSEPRVSRHLKILCDAGLLERFPQGQWVHYHLAKHPAAESFVQGLLAQLDRTEPQLRMDRERALGRGAPQRHAGSFESRLGRALQKFLTEANEPAQTRLRSVLLVGVEHREVLEGAAGLGRECAAIAHSRRAAQSARALVEQHGFACRILLASSARGLSARDVARAGAEFDAVVLDHPAASDTELAAELATVRRALAAGGRLWLFERYESLESPRARVVEHPLARLRRVLGEAGFKCARLSPLEADGEHVLGALALPESARPQGAGTAASAA